MLLKMHLDLVCNPIFMAVAVPLIPTDCELAPAFMLHRQRGIFSGIICLVLMFAYFAHRTSELQLVSFMGATLPPFNMPRLRALPVGEFFVETRSGVVIFIDVVNFTARHADLDPSVTCQSLTRFFGLVDAMA